LKEIIVEKARISNNLLTQRLFEKAAFVRKA
jgi:hypothetical protein